MTNVNHKYREETIAELNATIRKYGMATSKDAEAVLAALDDAGRSIVEVVDILNCVSEIIAVGLKYHTKAKSEQEQEQVQ